MDKSAFQKLVVEVVDWIGSRALDTELERDLNRTFRVGDTVYSAMLEACKRGDNEGWICEREAGGIRYGRVLKPGLGSHNFSVDVVDMKDSAGPHHVHPNGEIDLIMPLDGDAVFDDHAAGWLVYGPHSAHKPTVRGGRAYVLYLLPGGAIEFTARKSEANT